MRAERRLALTRRLFLLAAGVLLCGGGQAAVDPQLCFACHGPNGNSLVPAVPSLAAQPGQFIGTQLIMFREKRRVDPQMSPIAATLTNADINALGKFFAAQERAAPANKPEAVVAAEGRRLTEAFNCVACHGAALKGQQHIPRLAGQQPEYLRTQLRGFKAGTRFDMDGNMTAAAQPLTPKDIDVLADYLSGLE
jgi:cytochrome c553